MRDLDELVCENKNKPELIAPIKGVINSGFFIFNKEEHMGKQKTTMKEWISEHKRELIVGGILITGTVLIVWKRDAIFKTIRGVADIKVENDVVETVADKIVEPLLSDDFLSGLSGNRLTARELGNKMLCTAQHINKRLIANGFIEKLPWGEYKLTENGKLVGVWTDKTTAAGHSFSNIEWDEKVLEILFSAEEFEALNKFKATAEEILSRPAA